MIAPEQLSQIRPSMYSHWENSLGTYSPEIVLRARIHFPKQRVVPPSRLGRPAPTRPPAAGVFPPMPRMRSRPPTQCARPGGSSGYRYCYPAPPDAANSLQADTSTTGERCHCSPNDQARQKRERPARGFPSAHQGNPQALVAALPRSRIPSP